MNDEQKTMLIRIGACGVLFILALLLPVSDTVSLIIYLAAYAVIGWDILFGAVRGILHGELFDEHFLMTIASIGALCIGEYPEAVAVMLFYQVGELFQDFAVDKSRESITELMDIRPDYANIERDGTVTRCAPETVSVGDVIIIKPGEKIPLDGTVVSGTSFIDTSAMTGESRPRSAEVGDEVQSGCINQSGLLRVRVTKRYEDSTVAKILELVENSRQKKAQHEEFIRRFAKYYTPIVVIAAVLLFIIPSLISGNWSDWLHRALIFLVISCPCALVLSVPLSFFCGIGGASRSGILIKGGSFMEVLAKAEVVAFDKTGTLTRGVFEVTDVVCVNGTEDELLTLAALAESGSDHPLARSITAHIKEAPDTSVVSSVTELAGRGMQAVIDGHTVSVGNDKLMASLGITPPDTAVSGTIVHVARDNEYLGYIVFSDLPKPDAKKAISALYKCGIKRTVILSGDTKEAAEHVAAELGIGSVFAGLLPDGKVEKVEQLLLEKSRNTSLIFVGDGINDAPVLSRADVGIAMGALGSDAAIEAADVVLMDDSPSKIADAISISKKTLSIVRQNIVLALGVKLAIMILGALGIAGMWAAVFADVGVSVLAVTNAMRALRIKPKKK